MLKSYFHDLVCVYTTTRLIRVKSPLLAIVSFIITLLVLWSYIASIRLDYRRAYKASCPVQGAVISKLKGYASTERFSDSELNIVNPELYRDVWDASDLVLPIQGGEGDTGGFTLITNMKITSNQTRGKCSEKGSINGTKVAPCTNDADCAKEKFGKPPTHGILTGKCDNSTGSCVIQGWCPLEDRILPRNGILPLLEDVQNFTVLLKNTVEFPGCSEEHGSNILNSTSSYEYLRKCLYDADDEVWCPVFRIGDIVTQSGENFTEVAIMGAVFRIRIVWSCDFDKIKSLDECVPKYKFSRVDDIEGNIAAQGWNFRTVSYDSKTERNLTKHFGLKFIVTLEGEGRQRDIFLFVTTLGSYLGLFSVVALICDLLLEIMNCLRKRETVSDSFHEYGDRFGDEESDDDDDLDSLTKARRRNGKESNKHESE